MVVVTLTRIGRVNLFSAAATQRKTQILVLSAVCCLVVFLGGRAVIRWRLEQLDEIRKASLAELQSLQDQAHAAQLQADRLPDYPLPKELKSAVNKPGDFRLYRSVAHIPDSVQSAFAKAAHEKAFSMADPNGPWEATDVIRDPRLPRRRLAAVAVSADWCLLFYEHGGIGTNDNVAVFRQSRNRAEVVWHAYVARDVATPSDLGKALQEKSYREAPFF